MKLYRIKAIIFRHLLLTFRVFNKIIDILFWPMFNIVIWGFNSIQHNEQCNSINNQTLALVTALLMWQILFRVNMEICYSFVDELTSYNFSNIFSTPLHLFEWVFAVLVVGLIKACFTLTYGAFLIKLLYNLDIFSIGFMIIPFILLAIIIGWTVGFISASGIAYWGQSMRELIWVVVWIFVPFSNIFYSVTLLPTWAQTIAWFIPHSHLFEALRIFIATRKIPTHELALGFVLGISYLICAVLLFNFIFEKSRQLGFLRFERDS